MFQSPFRKILSPLSRKGKMGSVIQERFLKREGCAKAHLPLGLCGKVIHFRSIAIGS